MVRCHLFVLSFSVLIGLSALSLSIYLSISIFPASGHHPHCLHHRHTSGRCGSISIPPSSSLSLDEPDSGEGDLLPARVCPLCGWLRKEAVFVDASAAAPACGLERKRVGSAGSIQTAVTAFIAAEMEAANSPALSPTSSVIAANLAPSASFLHPPEEGAVRFFSGWDWNDDACTPVTYPCAIIGKNSAYEGGEGAQWGL